MKILGIGGKVGSGKDTAFLLLSDACTERGLKLTKISFAGPIKKICVDLFGWDAKRLADDLPYKEASTLDDGSPDPACQMLNRSRRQLMQQIGTECFRNGLDQNFWVIAMKLAIQRGEYDEFDVGVITDCRFLNECQFVRDQGGFLLRLVGANPTTEHSTHQSETEVDKWTDWDLVLENRIDPEMEKEESLDRFAYRLRNEVLSVLDPNHFGSKSVEQILTGAAAA